MFYSRIEVAQEYFEQLNYTLANEDSCLEMELLPFDRGHVVAVCGSGSRILPLLVKRPRMISVVDLSKSQLELCELRIETLREFDHEEYLGFWGYQNISVEKRKKLFQRLQLNSSLKNTFHSIFEANEWNSILFMGRWEKTFLIFSKVAKWVMGRNGIEKLFQCSSLEEQKKLVSGNFFNLRWKILLLILGNSRIFNTLLYRGSFPLNNSGKSYLKYYDEAFQRLFEQGLVRENFFLQLCLLGELKFPEGFPVEADKKVFEIAKKNLPSTSVNFIQNDLVEWVSSQSGIDFVSFSNVASYFKGDQEKSFLKKIRKTIQPKGTIVLRYYLHHPENLDRDGFENVTDRYHNLINKEKMQMYEIEVLQRSFS